jgi:hypothetical protein
MRAETGCTLRSVSDETTANENHAPATWSFNLDEPTRKFLLEVSHADVFRVAIRGLVHLETMLDDGIRDMLPGGAGRDIMRLNFSRRLSLATALGLIDDDVKRLIGALAKVRNEFAHGTIDDLDRQRADQLLTPLWKLYPKVAKNAALSSHLKQNEPAAALKVVLLGAHTALASEITRTRSERQERDEALAAHRQQQAFSAVIAELTRERQSGEGGSIATTSST